MTGDAKSWVENGSDRGGSGWFVCVSEMKVANRRYFRTYL